MSRPLNPWKLTGYKAGQNVVCKVTNAEPGGYAVLIPKDNLPGFLPTQATLKPGEEILAQFVCVHNNRILLSARFGQGAPGANKAPQQKVKWEDHLEQLDNRSEEVNFQRPDEGQANESEVAYQNQPNEFDYAPEQTDFSNPSGGAALISPPPSREMEAPPRPQAFEQKPVAPERPVPYVEKPATAERPAAFGERPATTERPAPYGERPATTERPAPYGERPATTERPAAFGERPATTERPANFGERPVTADRQAPFGERPGTAERPAAFNEAPAAAGRPAPPPVQLTEAEMAFDVWAPQAQPRKFHLKRATDLILPPVNVDTLKEFKIADYDVEWLITDLEGGMRTGCVKASSEQKRSRSEM